MPRDHTIPGADRAHERDCLPGRADNSKIRDNRQLANALALEMSDGEVRSLTGPCANLVRRLALAGPDGLRLAGPDLAFAEKLADDGLPLCMGPRDAKDRRWVALDPDRIAEVRHGA